MHILGISAFYHDSAAALIDDGSIVAAAQEERFTRKKHDASFPDQAIAYCLEVAGLQLKDIDYVTFYDSPYMLVVADVVENHRHQMSAEEQGLFGIEKLNVESSDIPSVTHVDYSARIQTVHKNTNPTYHALISRFKELTGCPVIVNTSFNVRGEPIVCTPEDAFSCFMGTEAEMLVIGNTVLLKDQQDLALKRDYKDAFELD